MADRKNVYSPVLVYFIENFGSVDNSSLKNVARDFYSVEDLAVAKNVLLEYVSDLKLVNLPRVHQHRAGPDRASLEVDDILLMLNFVDENRKMNDLPRFVTDKISLVPSQRLFEGDLQFLYSGLKKMDAKMEDMFAFVSKLYNLYTSQTTAHVGTTQVSGPSHLAHPPGFVQLYMNQHQSSASQSTVKEPRQLSSVPPIGAHSASSGGVLINKDNSVSDSRPQQQSAVSQKPPSWAVQVDLTEQATGITSSRVTESDKDDDGYTVVRNRRLSRRLRNNLPETVDDNTSVKKRLLSDDRGIPNTVSPHFINVTQGQAKQKKGPLVVGKRLSQSHSLLMGRKRKRYFYLDNVNPDYTARDVVSFLGVENINVVSCIAVKPRKRWQGQDTSDRAAFRICIYDDDEERFLDPYLLPRGISVYPWIFKAPRDREIGATHVEVGGSRASESKISQPGRQNIDDSTADAAVSLSQGQIHAVGAAGDSMLAESNQSFQDAMSSPLGSGSPSQNSTALDTHIIDDDLTPNMESTLLYDPSNLINNGDKSEQI